MTATRILGIRFGFVSIYAQIVPRGAIIMSWFWHVFAIAKGYTYFIMVFFLVDLNKFAAFPWHAARWISFNYYWLHFRAMFSPRSSLARRYHYTFGPITTLSIVTYRISSTLPLNSKQLATNRNKKRFPLAIFSVSFTRDVNRNLIMSFEPCKWNYAWIVISRARAISNKRFIVRRSA